ncbi:T9SS C-terminal target domain-containing protein [candidate division KSB1 bacterium]|nr:MAG: T9SS C-terminal target domain-containing protein [candidate division KSB1 bacterium]
MNKFVRIGCVLVAWTILIGISQEAAAQPPLKNVILMIGDGMSINQITAANYWQGVAAQPYQSFPVRVFQSTFAYGGSYDPTLAWSDFDYVMWDYTDSAPAASAMSTGFKVAGGQINIDPIDGHPLLTVQTRAEELGKATGVVTSVPWSHATPAAFGAHNVSRSNYIEIAQEMVNVSGLDVIMGCGHPDYNDNNQPTSASYTYVGGQTQWLNLKNNLTPYTLIQTRAEFQALASGPTPERVCGTACCRYVLQQGRSLLAGESGNGNALPYTKPLNSGVPTLAEMTQGALNVLDNDPDGFFVMIEGGAIDMAGHANQKGRMIEEQTDFNNAVAVVINWIETHSNWEETLLIITGDHETGYLWGEGSGSPAVYMPLVDNGAGNLPGMYFYSGGHTNSLVPVFAKGGGAEWFYTFAVGMDPVRGRYSDNTDIAHVIFGYYDEILAVELISFTAAAAAENIRLNWRTASETDNDHFEILRDDAFMTEVRATNSPTGSSYNWTDVHVNSGITYSYTLVSVDITGQREELSTVQAEPMVALESVSDFALLQNYPNPFNAATRIPFELTEAGPVLLRVFDLNGREMSILQDGEMNAGSHSVLFDASGLPSGMYWYRVESNGFTASKKMVVMK